MKTKDIFAK